MPQRDVLWDLEVQGFFLRFLEVSRCLVLGIWGCRGLVFVQERAAGGGP